ncbi:MAG TPA: energy transducer TonB, partial [Steroidobacteraceae bacterium]
AALALFLYATPACADLYTARVAYKKGDFQTAVEQFKELAELGQPQAQMSLASMYARGEGVPTSYTYAHAWASLAGQNGESQAAALAAELEPQLTPNSLRLSADIQAQYGQTKLNERLLPHILRGKEYEGRDPVKLSKAFVPEYPSDAQHKGVQGEIYAEFVVAPDGHPRMPRIVYAVPTGYFESTVRDSVLRSLFLPARIDGKPVSSSSSMLVNFKIQGVTIHEYGDLEKRVSDTKLKAEAGDPSAQMLYGMMIAGLPQLNKTYDQAIPWFLKAAQAGSPYAQYQIGTGLLRGRGCQCDNNKGEIWLEKAAQADQPDAQVSLAEYLLRDKAGAESLAGAMVWLERAVKQGNSSGKLLLSAILAANSQSDIRDPRRALALSDTLPREYKKDPSFWEIRAAAFAATNDYAAASKAQSEALSEATRLSWNLSPLQRRAAAYASHQPWYGDLLDF